LSWVLADESQPSADMMPSQMPLESQILQLLESGEEITPSQSKEVKIFWADFCASDLVDQCIQQVNEKLCR
jgi:hypothetical protein